MCRTHRPQAYQIYEDQPWNSILLKSVAISGSTKSSNNTSSNEGPFLEVKTCSRCELTGLDVSILVGLGTSSLVASKSEDGAGRVTCFEDLDFEYALDDGED